MRAGTAAAGLALALLASIAAAGCTQGSQQPASAGTRSGGPGGGTAVVGGSARVQWHACRGGTARLRCGTLKVPLNYARPSGRSLTLALSEVPATAPPGQRLGILLVNPGGPGASGLVWASYLAHSLSPAVAARYDIVGFDTRGVGSSVPALNCEPGFFAHERPDYIPANAAAERVLISRARTYAADCGRRYGSLLPYMTSANMARDMDRIRAGLGQRKLSFLGYSYGTYLGQVYATLFPHRVRRMVLDSTVDPTGAWWADNIGQDDPFQARMNAFYAWLARYNRVYHLGATAAQARGAWYAAQAKLAAHPIANSSGPSIGPAEYDDTFAEGAYDDSYWPQLGAALAAYLNSGSTRPMVTAFDELGKTSENLFSVYNAVECGDVAWPRKWAYWDSVTRRVYRSAPFAAWLNTWFNAACAFWPVHGPARPMRIGAPGLPGILMLQGTLDAATPYAGAQNAHKLLPTAKMVVVPGSGIHGQSLHLPPNKCVNGYLNRYLATGALPSRPGLVNATCPALPDPTPNG